MLKPRLSPLGQQEVSSSFSEVYSCFSRVNVVYGWYQFSGLKTVVKTSKSLESSITEIKKTIAEKTPSPDEALDYFRGVAKSYGKLIPGASSYIDPMFDTLDELKKSHGEETEKIIKGTYDEVKETVSKGGFDLKTGEKVLEILKRRATEVEELGRKVGVDFIKPVLDKHPQLREAVGGSYDELKRMVETYGPEAKANYDDLVKQLKQIFNKGVSTDSIQQAQNLVQQKAKEIRELGEKAGKDAWDKASKQAKPYLDKMPDVKKALDDNMQALLGSGSKNIQEIYDKIKDVADKGINKNNVQDLQNMIKEKAKQAKESGVDWNQAWKSVEQYIKKIPGGNEVRLPQAVLTQALGYVPQLKEFMEVVQDKGDDAQKLAEDTYNDIKKILEKRLDEAKNLTKK